MGRSSRTFRHIGAATAILVAAFAGLAAQPAWAATVTATIKVK
jgi:hypothetical protein